MKTTNSLATRLLNAFETILETRDTIKRHYGCPCSEHCPLLIGYEGKGQPICLAWKVEIVMENIKKLEKEK